MATKAIEAPVKKKIGRPRINRKARYGNQNAVGNPGGGRKPWAPRKQMIRDERTNTIRQQTDEEAWTEAKAMVRHMAAIGYPVEVMGRFLSPYIMDVKTLLKHFLWETENGRLQADLQVAGVAFRMAVSGRHEHSTWRWLERRVDGFQPKVDVNLKTPVPIQLLPGDV